VAAAARDVPARAEILRRSGSFAEVPADALVKFAAACRTRRYAHGELIVARGLPPEGLAVVISGAIRMASLNADGREVVYSVVQPGKVWGIVAAIDGAGATHETRAYGATEVLVLPRASFLKILDAQPALYASFARMLCHRLRKAHGMVDEFALVPLRQRLARQLCTLATAGVGGGASESARVPFTQAEIGGMLSASRPTVNRELRRLQREGLVELSYRGIRVRQFARLLEVCENKELYGY
jgi:CRP/FNR family cyclic AMP-dependent transcriptional regulator